MPAIERATQAATVLRHQSRGVGASPATGPLGPGGCLSAIEHSTPGGIDLTWGCPKGVAPRLLEGRNQVAEGGARFGDPLLRGIAVRPPDLRSPRPWDVPARETSPGRGTKRLPTACQPPASVTPGWAVLVAHGLRAHMAMGGVSGAEGRPPQYRPLGGDLAHPMEHGDVRPQTRRTVLGRPLLPRPPLTARRKAVPGHRPALTSAHPRPTEGGRPPVEGRSARACARRSGTQPPNLGMARTASV